MFPSLSAIFILNEPSVLRVVILGVLHTEVPLLPFWLIDLSLLAEHPHVFKQN